MLAPNNQSTSRVSKTGSLKSHLELPKVKHLPIFLFNLAFFLFYLFLNYNSELFGTYKIVLDLIDSATGKFSGSDIKTQLDLHTSISYSDDRLITIICKDSTSITNILDLFKRFSSVSGLKISPAKSKIIPINFTFSHEQKDYEG